MDQVLQTGAPTWRLLIEGLIDPRVGQNGLAGNIERHGYILHVLHVCLGRCLYIFRKLPELGLRDYVI